LRIRIEVSVVGDEGRRKRRRSRQWWRRGSDTDPYTTHGGDDGESFARLPLPGNSAL
jgi:hypothetical protein